MKILQVAHGFPPREQAGTELYTFYLARELRKRHEVLIFHREGNPAAEEYTLEEAEYEGLPVTRVVNNFTHVGHPLRYYKDEVIEALFADYLGRHRPDLVHFQHCAGLSASLLEMTVHAGLATVITLHDYWFMCARFQLIRGDGTPCYGPSEGANCVPCIFGVDVSGRPLTPLPVGDSGGVVAESGKKSFAQKVKPYVPRRVKEYVKRQIGYVPQPIVPPPHHLLQEMSFRTQYLRSVLVKAGLVITPSEYVRQKMVDHGLAADRVRAIPHGWDAPGPSGPASQDQSFDPGRVRFSYFGTLLRHKGVLELIEAFRELPGDHWLSIHGYGMEDGYGEEVRRQAKEKRVAFQGRYQHTELPSLLRETDVVVIPSLWPETFNLVVREAFAARRPVIASRIGALCEAFQEGEGGLFCEPGDVEGLRARMRTIAEEAGLYERLVAGIPRVKGMAEHAEEIEAAYGEAVLRTGRRQKGQPSVAG